MNLPPTSHDTMVQGCDRHTLRCIIRDAERIGGEWGTKRAASAKRALRREEEQDQQATRNDRH